MAKRLTIKNVKKKIYNKHGDIVKLDETTYVDTKTKARFIDIDYGEWWTYPHSVINGHRKRHVLSFKKVKDTIESKGGKLLSKTYTKLKDPIEIRCGKCNKCWTTTFDGVKYERWCPNCAIEQSSKNRSYKIEYVRKIIEDKGGKLLSDTYTNVKTKISIQCKYGHISSMDFEHIQRGSWCYRCGRAEAANKCRNSIDHIREVVEDKGGKLLSKKYKSNKHKIKILCEYGHTFEITYGHILSDKWCKFCRIKGKQRKLHRIIKNMFLHMNVEQEFYEFDWLYNAKTNGTQRIDIFVTDIKLAIEYDGEQHFIPVTFGGIDYDAAKKNLKKIKSNDRRKNRLIKKHTEDVKYFVRFNYKEKLTKGYVLEKLIKNGIPVNDYD